jgi:hypothetical protein
MALLGLVNAKKRANFPQHNLNTPTEWAMIGLTTISGTDHVVLATNADLTGKDLLPIVEGINNPFTEDQLVV